MVTVIWVQIYWNVSHCDRSLTNHQTRPTGMLCCVVESNICLMHAPLALPLPHHCLSQVDLASTIVTVITEMY